LIQRVITVICGVLFFTCINAQQIDSTTETVKDSVFTSSNNNIQDKDIVDVIRSIKIFNKKNLQDSNTLTKNSRYHFSFIPAIGYTLQTGFAGILSANVGFYSDSSTNSKISSILASVTYSQYNQTIIPFQIDYWSKNNKYNIYVDWRFMNYPSETFGLGGKTDPTDGYTINFTYIKLHQTILRQLVKNMYAGIGIYFDYFWNIREIDPPAGHTTSFQRYGLSNTEQSTGIALRYLYDSRLNQINPKNGLYANVVYRPNFKVLGSDDNWESLLVDLRKYFRFPASSNNILALWHLTWLTTGKGKPPYLFLPSTGWDDMFNTGRGYIQGRYRAGNMFYWEAEYRFNILRNGLLGGVAFANAQSFSRHISNAYSNVAPGVGGGIRIKLNKHSGANLCLDYAFGQDGSHGFFVNLGEVF
jgi:hypothetical protein